MSSKTWYVPVYSEQYSEQYSSEQHSEQHSEQSGAFRCYEDARAAVDQTLHIRGNALSSYALSNFNARVCH